MQHEQDHHDVAVQTAPANPALPKQNGRDERESETRAPKSDEGKKAPAKPAGPPWYRRPGIVAVVMIVVIGGAVGGALLWRHSRTYESTDDAFIDNAVQHVSPQIAGRVLRVLVNDNQDVAVGDVLVELDPADFQNRVEQARAGAAQAEAMLAEAEAQRAVVEAQREQARAGEGEAAAAATNAASDLERSQKLNAANVGAITLQQLDRSVADAKGTAAQLRAAQKGIIAAEAQVAHASKQIEAARAAVKSSATQVAQAELTRSYAQVKASVAGRIARKTVSPGNYVEPGAELMAVVPREVYVTANFKETQLVDLKRGQPVKIKVDSFPDLKLQGRVDSVQPATGQVFDVLPSQNAAGNWVKVVQRIPVKIVFDQLPDDPVHWLAPGMSVNVVVTVR